MEPNNFSLPPAPYSSRFDEEEKPKSNLSQDDFRKILMTPRAVSSKVRETPSGNREGGFKKPNVDKKPYKPQKPAAKEQQDAEQYRNRAQERREGNLGEYEETHRMLATVMETENPDISKLSYEQSKYLGGDTEYTHLVKGLDFVLLEKVRKEMEQTEAPTSERPAVHDDGEKISFHTPLGKKIFEAANPRPRPEKNELFFPGKMYFRFELDEDFGSDIPTNVIRSKTEFSEYQSKMVVPSSDLVIGKIIQLMGGIRQGTRVNEVAKKQKKKEKVEPTKEPVIPAAVAPQKPVIDLDDDIFPDVGKYVPDLTERVERKPKEGKPVSYFDKPATLDVEDVDMEIPGLPSLPKNIAIEGAQFALPGPKLPGPTPPPPKEGEGLDSTQIKAISSLVKSTVMSFKDVEKRAEAEAAEGEERQKRELQAKKDKEAEELRKKNEFRDAGMPMFYQESVTRKYDTYDTFNFDSDEEVDDPKPKKGGDMNFDDPKDKNKGGARMAKKDKAMREMKEVGKIYESKYGKTELTEKSNKRRKTE